MTSKITKEEYLKAKDVVSQYEEENNLFSDELTDEEKKATKILKGIQPGWMLGSIPGMGDTDKDGNFYYVENAIAKKWDNLPMSTQAALRFKAEFYHESDDDD